MRRNQWAAALVAVLLFCSGAAVGVLGHRYYTDTVIAKSAEDFRHHYVTEMRTRLHLTNRQVRQLEAILDDTKAKYKAVRDSYHPAMLKIRNEQISRVKSILTPDQVPAYEQLVAEHEQRAREQEERQAEQERARARERQREEQQQPAQ